MDNDDVIKRLPLLKGGIPAVPGMNVKSRYDQKTWDAIIIGVGMRTIDVRYTNEPTHMWEGMTARLRDPKDWEFVGSFGEEIPEMR